MPFIADTHSFIWYLTDDAKLGKKAKDILEKAEKGDAIIVVPTIVLAESYFIASKHRTGVRFAEVVDKVKVGMNFTTYPLDIAVIERIQKLDKLADLHDKIIVATAQLLNGSLITKDKAIKESKYVDVVW